MNLLPRSFPRRALVVALACVLGGVAAHGQRPQGVGRPLLIDFVAITADGSQPVSDLKPADVAIKIGGKARTVTSLVLKKIAPAAAASAAVASGASPPFSINTPSTPNVARSFIIVVDRASLEAGTEPAVRSAIETLLSGLNSIDRVAFSTAPRDTAQVGFGAGLAAVREAVAAFSGQRPATVNAGSEVCRTQESLLLLKTVMQPLAGSETPTSVVFIARDLSIPTGVQMVTPVGTGDAREVTCNLKDDDYRAVASAAVEARANVYVVQGDVGAQGSNDGLESLAGVTGAGPIMRVAGDGFAPRVLADASAYWAATVAGDPSDRPGQSARLEVKSVREGVTVRARPEAAVPRAAAPALATSGSTSPRDMVRSPAPFTDLQLRAAASVSRGQAGKMTVLVLAEPVDPTVKITAMTVAYFNQAGQGGSASPNQIAAYPIGIALAGLDAGQYRVRVAATDGSGKSGAVDVAVNLSLTPAGPLKLGGLLLQAAGSDGSNKPQLLFSTEEKVVVLLEVYGQIAGPLTVRFELATSDTGPALSRPLVTGGAMKEPDRFQVEGEVPIAELAPGDYVIRAIVGLEGQPEGTVLRTFRKVAK